MNSKKIDKEFLLKHVWREDTGYFEKAKEASKNILSHLGFKIINNYLKKVKTILDVGCGEGTKLSQLGTLQAQKFGVDISEDAIRLAKSQYPKISFKKGDVENLPYPNDKFEATLCAFVLEHTQNPRRVLHEMIRVTKKNGLAIVICPNFGAPNRHSPCFKGIKAVKLIKGLVRQLIKERELDINSWERVKPLSNKKNYLSDWDTIVEPEILTLINFFKKRDLKIEYWSSLWGEEVPNAHKIQKIFKFFATFHTYPFIYWGPQLLVIAEKK